MLMVEKELNYCKNTHMSYKNYKKYLLDEAEMLLHSYNIMESCIKSLRNVYDITNNKIMLNLIAKKVYEKNICKNKAIQMLDLYKEDDN